jgi:hypothetical protein
VVKVQASATPLIKLWSYTLWIGHCWKASGASEPPQLQRAQRARRLKPQGGLADANAYLRDRDGVSSIGIGRHLLWQQQKTWRQADQLLPAPQRLYRTLSQEDFSSHCEQTGGVSSPSSAAEFSAQQGGGFLQPGSLLRPHHSRSMLSARCDVCGVRLRLHLSVDYSQRWPHLAISVRRRIDSGCDISPWTR